MRFPLVAPGTSAYQGLKLRLLSLLPLAKDAIHVYIGVGGYAGTVLLFRLPLGSGRALVPGFLVSLGMEYFDLRDNLRANGHLLWADSLKDIVNTNLIPLAVVLLARFRDRRPRGIS
ncbi:MAG TPA: hypothetical protein VGN09_11055 [Vicinamibacteria bacterium]